MKRLIQSSKFWVTVIGTLFSGGAYALFDDQTYALAILTAFTAGVIGTVIEDVAKKRTAQ